MIVDCAVYEDGVRTHGHLDLDDAARAMKQDGTFVWIGLKEPSAAELAEVAATFNLHDLAVEDAEHAHQRPKLERYGASTLLVCKTARYVDHDEIVSLGEVLLFLGEGFVVSVRHGDAGDMGQVRAALEADPERLAQGPGAVAYALVDRVVDEFAEALRGVEEDIDEIQAQVFDGPSAAHAQRIFKLKREVLEFRQAAVPLGEPLDQLTRTSPPGFGEELRPYFRDVHDHLIRTTSRLTAIDELLTSALDVNVAQVGMRQNEDMRKISAWVAIAAVPTMLAGVYGMNFKHMPELESTWGYPAILTVMVGACLALYRNFKHRDWL